MSNGQRLQTTIRTSRQVERTSIRTYYSQADLLSASAAVSPAPSSSRLSAAAGGGRGYVGLLNNDGGPLLHDQDGGFYDDERVRSPSLPPIGRLQRLSR